MAELESSQTLPRTEIAEYLHEFADELGNPDVVDAEEQQSTVVGAGTDVASGSEHSSDEAEDPTGVPTDPVDAQTAGPDDRVTLVVGDNSATVNPPESPEFDIEVESDSSLIGDGEKQSVSFELEWTVENPDADDRIEIQ